MSDFLIYLAKILVPLYTVLFALWYIAEKLFWAAEYYWRAQGDKTTQAALEERTARYRSLGVNCHGHCYVFGCKYERITDELHGLGIEQDVVELLVETVNGVPHRQPCDCGKALLPLSSIPRADDQEEQPSATAETP